jgi:hypothetical protein
VRVGWEDTAVTQRSSVRHINGKFRSKAISEQASYRPRLFQEVKAPTCQDNQHIEVEILSAVCTGLLYPPRNIPVTHSF